MYVLSGATGTAIYTINGGFKSDGFGQSVSGVGDLDGDLFPDFLVGAKGWDESYLGPDGTSSTGDEIKENGRVYAYSGFDGSLFYTVDGENPDINMGICVREVGDLNGDTVPDFTASAIGFDLPGPDGTLDTFDDIQNVGRVYALSGFDGSTLWSSDGENAGDNLGTSQQSVSGIGDVNGDGTPDIAAGAERWDEDFTGPDGTGGSVTTNTGDELQDNGRVYVYSGFDGSTLFTIEGQQTFTLLHTGIGKYFTRGEKLGSSVSALGDMNGDGISDFLVSADSWDDLTDPGRAGADGTVGTFDDIQDHGRVYTISGTKLSLTADVHELSLSVANAQTMTIDAGVVNAGKNYWLFTGFAASGDTPGVTMAPGVVIPLNQPDPLTSFVIGLTQLGGGAPTFAGWKSTLDGFGKATPSLNTFGPTPAPLGVTLHHAALVYTAGGLWLCL